MSIHSCDLKWSFHRILLLPYRDYKWKIPALNGPIFGKQVKGFRHCRSHAEGLMRSDMIVLF